MNSRSIRYLPVLFAALLIASPALAQSGSTSGQTTKPATQATTRVDLNTASQAQLDQLPDIDPATAKTIIANRPYSSVDDLSKAGIPTSTIDRLRPLVKVGASGKVAGKTGTAVDKGAAGAAKGAEAGAAGAKKGANKAAEGVEKGVGAAASGVQKGAEATAGAMGKVREKVTGTAGKQPPQKGMVWVDTTAGVYYVAGDVRYGNTDNGEWMTPAAARKAGYKAAPIKKK